MSKLDRLEKLKEKLQPKFDAYAERHGGERACVEDLLDFLIAEERASEEAIKKSNEYLQPLLDKNEEALALSRETQRKVTAIIAGVKYYDRS